MRPTSLCVGNTGKGGACEGLLGFRGGLWGLENLAFSIVHSALKTIVFIFQIALSWPLWNPAAGRTFPLMPLWGAFHFPDWLHWVLILGLLGLLASLIVKPKNGILIVCTLAWLVGLILLDLNRLQVWVYFYGLMLLLHAPERIFDVSKKTKDEPVGAVIVLLAIIYGWSGFFKITPYFAEDNFPWFCSAFDLTRPFGEWGLLGYGVGVAEMLLGPALLWRPTRRAACILAAAMHLCIIMVLSPWGLDWNHVVIPWNGAMIYLLWRIFAGTIDIHPFVQSSLRARIALIVAGILPTLNPIGGWPDALSWKMYSNTQVEWSLYAAASEDVCETAQFHWKSLSYDQKSKLLLDDWSRQEMGTPFVAADFSTRALRQYWCDCVARPDSAGLLVLRVWPWDKTREKIQYYPCVLLNNH